MPPDAPLVTVVIPTFRQAEFLVACLDSVANSTYRNIEVVVIDDCSPDNEQEVFAAWLGERHDVRFSYQRGSINRGVSDVINAALRCTTGEFVTVIAADDLVHPLGIERRVAYLTRHPSIGAVFGDADVIDGSGSKISPSALTAYRRACGLRPMRPRHLCDQRLLPFEVVFNWAVPGPVLMLRRSVFAIVGPYDSRSQVEDWDMYLRLSQAGLLGYIDCVVASYRVHPTSAGAVNARTGRLNPSLRRTALRHARRSRGIVSLRMHVLAAKYRVLELRSPRMRTLLNLPVIGAAVCIHVAYLVFRTTIGLRRTRCKEG